MLVPFKSKLFFIHDQMLNVGVDPNVSIAPIEPIHFQIQIQIQFEARPKSVLVSSRFVPKVIGISLFCASHSDWIYYCQLADTLMIKKHYISLSLSLSLSLKLTHSSPTHAHTCTHDQKLSLCLMLTHSYLRTPIHLHTTHTPTINHPLSHTHRQEQ